MPKKIVIATPVAEKCIEYRKRAKRGEHLTSDESKFCERMFKMFPAWYAETEKRVFNETVPFGSTAHKD